MKSKNRSVTEIVLQKTTIISRKYLHRYDIKIKQIHQSPSYQILCYHHHAILWQHTGTDGETYDMHYQIPILLVAAIHLSHH